MKTAFIFTGLMALAAAQFGSKGSGAKGSAPAKSSGGGNALECITKCATDAFGADVTSFSANSIPCAKEGAGPGGYTGAEFKACICKDAKVTSAMACQGKCQYGSFVTSGFKSYCG